MGSSNRTLAAAALLFSLGLGPNPFERTDNGRKRHPTGGAFGAPNGGKRKAQGKRSGRGRR